MPTQIITKNSSTGSSVPSASDLVQGELAVNVTDKRLFTENSSGAVVELATNPSTLTIGSVSVTAILDEDNFASNSATSLATQQSIKAYVDANVSSGTMSSWVLEDGDGTEVSVTNAKEVKFVEGGGLDINWTDTDNGTDGDPYDLTFTINSAQTDITSLLATDIKIGEDDETKIDFETADQINFYADNTKRVTIDSTGLTVNSGSIETATIDFTDGDNAITIADGGGITAAAGITSTAAANAFGASSVTGALQLKNGSTSAGFIEFFEDSDNGTNKVTLIGPASTADITLTLPSSDGDADQFLQTDGSGNLSFATAGGAYTAWAIKTTNYTASAGDQLVCNHASTAFTITLPSGSANDTVIIANAGVALITIGRNGSQKINSSAEDGTLIQGASVQLVYVDDTIGWFAI